jgi:dihydroorotase/N-acyl-D-amino-acid deacylase
MNNSIRLAAALALLAACANPPRTGPAPDAPYDLLIRGGRIVDGTGSPWYRGDVAVRRDRIVAVGLLPGARARDTIDATGLVVAPGFIDMLGHSEYPLLADPRAISKITQGVTTEITGEVTSVVPVNENTLRELPPRPARASPGPTSTATSRRWSAPARHQPGHLCDRGLGAALRDGRREPPRHARRGRADEGARGRRDAAGRDGALQRPHLRPRVVRQHGEVTELARVAASFGGGYASHIRSEGDRLVEAINEAIAIGEGAGTWVQIHHLKASGRANWGKMRPAVAAIEAARARGVDVTADQYPYIASGTGLDATIPNWAHAGGTDSLLARLRDPVTRARLRGELTSGGTDWRIGTSAGGPSGVMIASVGADSLRRYQGMRLSQVAEPRGQEVVDALFDVLLADRARTAAIYFSMSEEDLEWAMKQPWVSVGMDAGARAADSTVTSRPHPRAYGTFPRILCRYVRERQVITLEDAVRKFTALPASRVGLADRGVVKAGMYADLTLFDPATVCDRATFENPVQTSVGIRHVLVNGTPVVRNGAVTGARSGRGLRRGGGR